MQTLPLLCYELCLYQSLALLQGHTDTVEDVVFQPNSAAELASVADDTKLLFWDTRSGSSPVVQLKQAHGQSDLHVVDWSSLRSELVATGLVHISFLPYSLAGVVMSLVHDNVRSVSASCKRYQHKYAGDIMGVSVVQLTSEVD